ncbi:MAG: TfoX/Sxy family protein [Agrobacterium sp.]|nr:TfoX/Sxy family protein [Agrobacterium sp.]
MATDLDFTWYIQDQLADLGKIDVNKMFGEYGVYLDGKIIALLCDNVFYLKRTTEVVPYLREILEAPPYPGSGEADLRHRTDR